MAPDAEDYEEAERLNVDYQVVPVHQGRRILPEEPLSVQAWVENEEAVPGNDSRTNSPGENRRLLGNGQLERPRLQSGLTVLVWGAAKKPGKCKPIEALTTKTQAKPPAKTKLQKRKEKLAELLRPPYFVLSMILCIVLVHLCVPEAWHVHLEWLPDAWLREPWRLFTYGFVHSADTSHIALNALVALAVGWWLEREQGWARVAVLWGAGVVAGALGAGALQPHTPVVGASGAVYALLTAHLPNVSLRFGHIPLWWFRPLSVVVLVASEVSWTLLSTSSHPHVAWAAHMLGAAIGVLLGFLVFTGENSSKAFILASRITSGILLMAGTLAAIFYYSIPHPPHRRPLHLI